MGRREELLEAVREHALPLGPFGNPDERDELEREWEGTLTEADCVELLAWVRATYRPAEAGFWDRRHAQQVATHVGRVGRRCRGPILLGCLLDMLGDTQCSELALDAVFELEESSEYDNLLLGAATAVVPINAELARVATPEQVERLALVADSPSCLRDLGFAIRDILRAVAATKQAEPSAAADPARTSVSGAS